MEAKQLQPRKGPPGRKAGQDRQGGITGGTPQVMMRTGAAGHWMAAQMPHASAYAPPLEYPVHNTRCGTCGGQGRSGGCQPPRLGLLQSRDQLVGPTVLLCVPPLEGQMR